MDLRRSTEVSLLAGRDFASQRDPFVPVRTADLEALVRSHDPEDGPAELALSWQCIELEGATALGRALRANSAVTSLNLSCNALGDGGALALAAALRNSPTSALRVLNLSQNKLGDSGAAAVASLIQGSAVLEEVALNGNEIGDLGAGALAQAVRGSSALRKLWLGDNAIGERGADALADALATRPPEQLGVLWLGKQRPLLEPYPTAPAPARGRVEVAIDAIDRRFGQELTRKEQWTDQSHYGNKLAESVDNNFSSMARLERHAFDLRYSLEQQESDPAKDTSVASSGSASSAVGGGSKLAELNASNAELQRRVDTAKQALQRLDAASGTRGFAHPEDAATAAKRASGLATTQPVAEAQAVRGQQFARQPSFEPTAPLEWNAQHPQPAIKGPGVLEVQRAPVRPREGPSMVEGSLGLPQPRTTGHWPTA
jgi:hypothetical protein